jgi:hypothetical protein
MIDVVMAVHLDLDPVARELSVSPGSAIHQQKNWAMDRPAELTARKLALPDQLASRHKANWPRNFGDH